MARPTGAGAVWPPSPLRCRGGLVRRALAPEGQRAAHLFRVAVGVAACVDSVVQWRRAPRNPRWWLREHFNAMIGNGIAVHIAFVSIGLRSVLAGLDLVVVQYLAWFGPLAVAVVAAVWLNRKYGGANARAALPAGALDRGQARPGRDAPPSSLA